MQPANTVSEEVPGVWVIDFPSKEDVVAERCGHLVPPLVEASKRGPLVLVAAVPADLRMVESKMSLFWLQAMISGGVNVNGIAVVTKSLAVRSVVTAFGMTMKLRKFPIHAMTFKTREEAVAWARSVVEPRRSEAAPAARSP